LSLIDLRARTLLHFAARAGSKLLVEELLEKGASLIARDKDGIQPLSYAVVGETDKECADIVRVLLDAGARVEAKDNKGWTALHFAIRNSFEDAIKILLQYGANPLIISSDGETPESLARDVGGPVAELLNHPPPPIERKLLPAATESYLRKPQRDSKRQAICEHFQGLIWSPTEVDLKPLVWNLIYDDETSDEVTKKLAQSQSRWIHLPLNDVSLPMFSAWVCVVQSSRGGSLSKAA
jgi:hypothetical protein